MDRREPPRIGSVDETTLDVDSADSTRAPSRRFARLVTLPTARKLAVSKVGRIGIIAAVVLGLLVVAGSSLSHSLVKWLHSHKIYYLAFQDIQLIPEPPRWIKPGRSGLLEQVREGREHLKSFSMAEVNLDNLLIAFRRNPWVERAVRATKAYPNKVSVYLVYFEPVAVIQVERATYAVDRGAIVLPEDDIDFDAASPLITIIASKPREEPKPGIIWPEDDDASRDSKPVPKDRVVIAARVAGFLKQQIRDTASTSTSFIPDRIFANDGQGLFVQMKDKTLVYWGPYQDVNTPGEPSDQQKWERLAAKAKADGGLKLKDREYLDFFGDTVRVRRFQ